MSKMSKRICLGLLVILFPIICLIGMFSINATEVKYETSSIMTNGVINLLSGEFYGTNVSDEDSAYYFLDSIKNEYGFSNANEEFVFEKTVDVSNGKVYRFKQVKNGVDVYGRQLIINVDEQGRVLSVSGNYKNSNAQVVNTNILEFKNYATSNLGINEIYDVNLVIYNSIDNVDAFCYLVNCLYEGDIVDIVIDASNFEFYQIASSSAKVNNLSNFYFVESEIHEQLDSNGNKVDVNVETYRNKYTSETVYLLSDKNRKIYMTVMADGKSINNSNFFEYYLLDSSLEADDPMVVEAYKNLVKCYDFYANAGSFGTSIVGLKNEAGKSINLIAVVHAVENVNESYDNAAYWILNSNSSYAYFLFGDGGSFAEDYATSLDVVGHEYQHGITTSICNLEYLNEAGAINEAISDIFGAIIEGHEMSDKDFWLMGEDITLNGIAGFRDMSNPKNNKLAEEYPSHVNEMYPLCTKKNCNHATDDYGGVHYNSVILTHATYKMYSYDNEFFTPFVIGQLWYNTLSRLTTKSTFADFRIQMISSANALGYAEDKIAIINRSFADVGIIGEDSEFNINFYSSKEDADAEQNLVETKTAIYGSSIIMPSAKLVPEGKLFYYWTDNDGNKYLPGSAYMVEYEDVNFWAYYVTPDEIQSLNISFEGNGSELYPYKIYSAVEWVYLSYLINNNYYSYYYGSFHDKDYALESDINLNNIDYEPIGNSSYPFAGFINGGNHTISGLNLSNANDIYAGLFGVNKGSICNLNVGFGLTSSKAQYTGGIAGVNYNYISNCVNKLSITSNYTVGGIAGITYSNGGNSIVNSYSEGNLIGNIVGGIVGDAVANINSNVSVIRSGYIGNVYVTGNLTGNIVGGIVGRANGYYIVNSMMIGEKISLSSSASDAIVGGIVGYLMHEPINDENEGNTECYSGVLSCKVVSDFVDTKLYTGMIVGKFIKSSLNGKTIFENNTIKHTQITNYVGNITELTPNDLNTLILNENKISESGIFEGDFDFDNPNYYTNSNNWSITKNVSLYNLESVWTINENEQMPKILNYEFWISYAAPDFSGGDGSLDNPYLIGTAEELALLALVINSDASYYGQTLNSYFSNKAYKLTADIDLTGKIWVGIGCTIFNVYKNEEIDADVRKYLGFSGVFDGNGHTISNMNSIAASSVEIPNSAEYWIDHYVYSYEAGLFSLLYSDQDANVVISNLNLRNVSVSGSYTGAVVGESYCSLSLSNVKVLSGNINSDYMAGGLVGLAGGTLYNSNVVIKNSMNNARVSSRIVGGLIGQVENLANNVTSTVVISSSVNRGSLIGFGDEILQNGVYYMSYVGGIVGVVGVDNISINDTLFIGDIAMYAPGYAGGLIGSTSYAKSYNSANQIKIESMYNKITGDIIYKFDNTNNYYGSYLGAALNNDNLNILIDDDSTRTNNNYSIIGKEFEQVSSNLENVYSSDKEYENGLFDFNTLSYYRNNFSSTTAWSMDAISNMLVTVNFIDWDGTIVKSVYVPYGGTLNITEKPIQNMTRASDVKYHYTFNDWEKFDNIHFDINTSIKAIYNNQLRSYNIIYKLEDGTIVFKTTGNYGSEISQDVKAPEKVGNLLVSYEFSGWEFEADTVTGEMVGVAKYKTIIGSSLLKMFVITVVAFIIISMIIKHYKEKKRRNETSL